MTVLELNPSAEQEPETGIALQTSLTQIIDTRDAAISTMIDAAEALDKAYTAADMARRSADTAAQGARFYGSDRTESAHFDALFRGGFDKDRSLEVFRAHVDASVWTHLLTITRMSDMMDREAREEFDRSLMANVPEVTFETVTNTFSQLRREADLIFKRGLANAFSKLDRRFRSHDGFKIGSRIILTNVFDEWGSWNYHGRARETITDVERVFAILDNHNPNPGSLISAIDASRGRGLDPRQSECEAGYFRIKGFKNGNCHIWFTRPDLVEKANKLLADYYGATLGDAYDVNTTTEDLRTGSTLPAKNLAFFPSPEAVVDQVLSAVHWRNGPRVLEPSAGVGNIVKAALKKGASVHAIEIHPDRARILEGINHPGLVVTAANFLSLPTDPSYDLVLMNPPFEGTHWMAHVYHAFQFLKPGGQLVAVLPAGAEVNESLRHVEFRDWANRFRASQWGSLFTQLPAESFAESGTRVQTVILTIRAPNAPEEA